MRVALLKENIARAEDLVKLTLSRFKQGLAAEGDNLLAQRELEALNAAVPLLNSAIFDAVSRIGLLLGTYSGDVTVELKKPGALPHTPERVRPGQPIELLRRRPDIRQAETELAAANARIGVAAADLFPRASITTGVGVQGGREIPGAHPPVHGLIWSVGPGAYWPLLDFGQLDAAVKQAEYRTDEILADYRKTVIAAVEEVNTSLVRYRSSWRRPNISARPWTRADARWIFTPGATNTGYRISLTCWMPRGRSTNLKNSMRSRGLLSWLLISRSTKRSAAGGNFTRKFRR